MQIVVAFSASLSSVFWSDRATALSKPVVYKTALKQSEG